MKEINKELAKRIAGKLGAEIKTRDGARDIASVWEGGRLVATFGIRRGSNKDVGHDHVPAAIFLRPAQAKLLGQCPMSREEWVEVLRSKDKL